LKNVPRLFCLLLNINHFGFNPFSNNNQPSKTALSYDAPLSLLRTLHRQALSQDLHVAKTLAVGNVIFFEAQDSTILFSFVDHTKLFSIKPTNLSLIYLAVQYLQSRYFRDLSKQPSPHHIASAAIEHNNHQVGGTRYSPVLLHPPLARPKDLGLLRR
jgi:hypothetical protein